MNRRLLTICGLALVQASIASTATAATAARLSPAAAQEPNSPLRRATLAVRNDTQQTVRAIRLQSGFGGPAVVVSAVVAPGSSGDFTVQLPALAPQQTYDVALLTAADPDAPAAAAIKARIQWPAELVNDGYFRDRRYQQVAYEEVLWSASQKRLAILIALLGCLAMAGAMLAPKGWLRAGAVVVLAAATTAVAAWVITAWPLVAIQHATVHRGDSLQRIQIVAARRTTVWTAPNCVPLYLTDYQMQTDRSVIFDGKLILPLQPGEVRLVQRQ